MVDPLYIDCRPTNQPCLGLHIFLYIHAARCPPLSGSINSGGFHSALSPAATDSGSVAQPTRAYGYLAIREHELQSANTKREFL